MQHIKQLLQNHRNLRHRFKLSFTEDEATELLTAAYISQVEQRHCRFSADAETMSTIRQAAQWLTTDNKFGLMLMGAPGNGKTTLTRAIYQLIDVLDLYESTGNVCHRLSINLCTAKQLVRMAQKDWRAYREQVNAPMLAIDDLGEEAVDVMDYGNIINPVIDALSFRYNAQSFTIISTNLPNSQIRRDYGDRIADRLNEMMQVIIFTNPSFRR